MIRRAVCLLVLLVLTSATSAKTLTWTLTNHNKLTYTNQPVRLGVQVPPGADPAKLVVTADGEEVPYQVTGRAIWVAPTIGPAQSIEYKVTTGGSPKTFEPLVTLKRDGKDLVLANDVLAVKVPANGETPERGPILGVKPAGGRWMGGSRWKLVGALPIASLKVATLGEGPLFASVRLRYDLEVPPNRRMAEPYHSRVTLTVMPGQPVVHVEESHRMSRDIAWTFVASDGWKPTMGLVRRWHSGAFKGTPKMEEMKLVPGETRLPGTLINLQPRWTQAFDEGWFFGATDGTTLVGGLPVDAGSWYWGHDNVMPIRVKENGDYAGIECPTWRGRRSWLLVAGKRELADDAVGLAIRISMQALDKLTHEYILAWPGKEPGGLRGEFFYTGMTNPTGARRRMGRQALQEAGKKVDKAGRGTLAKVQVNLDPDWFCGYWQHWSPINPNFHSDFIKLPVGRAANLKKHPKFEAIRAQVEDVVHTDLYHAVILPGGAGTECPGYLAHSMGSWAKFAEVGKKHLGFDLAKWPRFKAAASFIAHSSQPVGGGKRAFHPGGDTHPGRPDPIDFAAKFGVRVDAKKFETEELPGFGAILRNRPGTNRETYVAFKSGPARGHYHGDQLSLHYCARGKKVAIDHQCSYSPRAPQEHMHNRVAFATDEWPYANMDGYERVIGFDKGEVVDYAIGQVASQRLRKMPKYPGEQDWDALGPYKELAKRLVYRRTVVLVKGGPEDYVVLRDQWWGPKLKAVHCLHVLTGRMKRDGPRVEFGNMTLFRAHPSEAAFESFPWSHDNGPGESTQGARFAVEGEGGEFVTVLYPGKAPKMEAIPGGVRVGGDEVTFAPARSQEDPFRVTVKRGGKTFTGPTEGQGFDLNRPQGVAGLFIPETGYDFGPMPQWLVNQWNRVPDWHVPWPPKPTADE